MFCYVHRHNFGSHHCISLQSWNWFPVSAFWEASVCEKAGHLRQHLDTMEVARQAYLSQYVDSEKSMWPMLEKQVTERNIPYTFSFENKKQPTKTSTQTKKKPNNKEHTQQKEPLNSVQLLLCNFNLQMKRRRMWNWIWVIIYFHQFHIQVIFKVSFSIYNSAH